jgi:hypothetical protein
LVGAQRRRNGMLCFLSLSCVLRFIEERRGEERRELNCAWGPCESAPS